MTHTPGPWRIGPKHKDGTFAIHAGKASVVHCTPFGSSNGHAEANARLIAAAPELLEACKAIFDYYDEDDLMVGDIEKLRAAIAKATNNEAEGK